jgi:hypothetical protein
MLAAMALPALAHPTIPLDPTLPLDVTHSATDNIEYLGRFPEHFGTAGGRLSDDGQLFYLTDPRGVFVYDVSEPASPTLLGSVAVFQSQLGTALAQEDPDTNGEILLVDGSPTPSASSRLQVVDVSNPRAPRIVSSVGVTDHTWTCVSGPADAEGEINTCQYAYGRTGHIIDLTDPANPVNLDATWRQAVDYGNRSNSPYTHDLTEIRPGLVMSAGSTAILMDTSDPTEPVEVARITQPGRFSSLGYHSVEWAQEGRSPYAVLGTEIAPPVNGIGATANTAGTDCEGDESVIETWDARDVIAAIDEVTADGLTGADARAAYADLAAEFVKVDAFDAAGRGIFLQGQAPGHVLYCAHWMDLRPDFDEGGKMVVSYYDRGTRLVDVDADGNMTEYGWIVAAESYSGSARWISDDVVYIMDYRRGMEVIRIDHEEAATGVVRNAPDLVALTSGYEVPGALHHVDQGLVAAGFFFLLLAGIETRRRLNRG